MKFKRTWLQLQISYYIVVLYYVKQKSCKDLCYYYYILFFIICSPPRWNTKIKQRWRWVIILQFFFNQRSITWTNLNFKQISTYVLRNFHNHYIWGSFNFLITCNVNLLLFNIRNKFFFLMYYTHILAKRITNIVIRSCPLANNFISH